jgi:hypothetical protein
MVRGPADWHAVIHNHVLQELKGIEEVEFVGGDGALLRIIARALADLLLVNMQVTLEILIIQVPRAE